MWMAANDLRQRLRDRSFFLFGVIVPFVLALVFSLLLGPVIDGGALNAKLALVDEDGSLVSRGMRTALDAVADAGVATWQEAQSVDAARSLLADGDVDAVIVIPESFGSAVLATARGPDQGQDAEADAGVDRTTVGGATRTTEAPDLRVLGDPDSTIAAQLAEGVASGYLSRLRSASWAAEVLASTGQPVVPGLVFAQVASAPDALSLVSAPTSDRQLDAKTYYAVGMAVFFVFFIVQLGVTGLLDEERDGTLTRLLAAPIARASILAGKVLSSMAVGVLSMVVLAVASTLVMGADWGNPVGVLLLIVAVVAAASGILMLVAGVARSSEAAGNVQAVIAITLGALGGAFFQLPQREGLLEWLQRASPHYWFMRGMADLAGGGSVGVIGVDLLALAAFALVTGSIGWLFLRRRLTR